ncbi:U32 family peptidase [Mobilitalea sibirica]|uniref:U32 family peptidase n=1 Tax=Mobilitalea sibirica TaxID=1462919 RepID=A0A8J7KV40_9FIRM|nr:U32 family peptidase [Mobilitalea sibirica]MBH1939730.1 U32 family peptidase [Mobilitalea sibirica]
MDRQIEILAPAGSYESMRAAMNAGCDAVYIGGNSFGARAYANNLEEEALLRAIDETHIRDKKLYLTVNTLIKEQERIEKLYNYLIRFYLQGLDAVIVQDVGVMHFIHHNFPKLPIHASTQTTLTMAQGANLLKETGVTRLVTARELSLKEIRLIRDNTDMEIETFVHGALCYCYSGQCLMSSIIGGRSGNRGRCAQPCRMPYRFHSGDRMISSRKEPYLLSPKDINTVALIPELVEAGIDSFKIEGRMKRPEYAAGVTAVYRKYLDYYLTYGNDKFNNLIHSREYETDMKELMDLYNRGGFSQGYGKEYHGKKMMSMTRPNHSGVYVGEITGTQGKQVVINLKEAINAQDILEIRNTEEEAVYEFTVKDPHEKEGKLITNVGMKHSKIRIGDRVYRTKNNNLLTRITADYIEKDTKLGIQGILRARLGKELALTLTYKDITITAYHEIVQAAIKQPMTKEKLSAPLEKLGDTLYRLDELEIEADENIFIPVAWLNEIRRNGVQSLQDAITGGHRRNLPSQLKKDKAIKGYNLSNEYDMKDSLSNTNNITKNNQTAKENGDKTFGICVCVQRMDQFQTVITYPEVDEVHGDYDTLSNHEIITMARTTINAGKKFYLVLPHICRALVYEKLKKDIVSFIEENDKIDFIVKNFEEISLLQTLMKEYKINTDIKLNYNLYIFNKDAKEFYWDKGLYQYTAPVELNYMELMNLGVRDCDLLVYGYLPLMISAQCLYESTKGCEKCKAGQRVEDYLVDRLDKKFYVQTHCLGCYNTIYNGQCLSLLKQSEEIYNLKPRNLRLDFTFESIEEVQSVLKTFIDVYYHGSKTYPDLSDYTTGHFKRGVE